MNMIDKLTLWNFEQAKMASEETARNAGAALTTTLVISLGLVVVSIALSMLITTGLSRVLGTIAGSLRENSLQVAGAAGEISAASQTLAEGSSEQAASLEETSSSLEEMASMTQRNADNASQANALAKEARAAADKGAGDMQAMAAPFLARGRNATKPTRSRLPGRLCLLSRFAFS